MYSIVVRLMEPVVEPVFGPGFGLRFACSHYTVRVRLSFQRLESWLGDKLPLHSQLEALRLV